MTVSRSGLSISWPGLFGSGIFSAGRDLAHANRRAVDDGVVCVEAEDVFAGGAGVRIRVGADEIDIIPAVRAGVLDVVGDSPGAVEVDDVVFLEPRFRIGVQARALVVQRDRTGPVGDGDIGLADNMNRMVIIVDHQHVVAFAAGQVGGFEDRIAIVVEQALDLNVPGCPGDIVLIPGGEDVAMEVVGKLRDDRRREIRVGRRLLFVHGLVALDQRRARGVPNDLAREEVVIEQRHVGILRLDQDVIAAGIVEHVGPGVSRDRVITVAAVQGVVVI